MGGDSIDNSKFGEIEKESSKLAIEMGHGLMVEALKSFMFTQPK